MRKTTPQITHKNVLKKTHEKVLITMKHLKRNWTTTTPIQAYFPNLITDETFM